ncbi:Hypothetical protein PHPALM_4483 [Phytophthora palmivora]|uniref:Uncharacterized protein n=1 Tax=Phytophthora palmivora TaxID=4796 RepID=A0A2P4YJR0_9STRA|nr:Hypothetical protein PHPALM_4483 [Phytophthora palmivora]
MSAKCAALAHHASSRNECPMITRMSLFSRFGDSPFGVHVITWLYNALYAYCYWKLQETNLNLYLAFYQVGMPQSDHHAIAVTCATTSAVHGICILLMVGGSFWKRSLVFTPWSSCTAGFTSDDNKTGQRLSFLVKLYDRVTYPCGLFGVKGKYFELVHVCREIVETTLQTVQAYRMSAFLPRTILNRFYVILLGINCWSSVIVDTIFFSRDEAQRRFACIFFDCLLDLMASMGVELIVLLSYVDDYDFGINGFDGLIWYNDEWVARALNEFQIIFIVSWSDLIVRTMFSLGLVITTTSMKKLLCYIPRNGNKIARSTTTNFTVVRTTDTNQLEETQAGTPVEVFSHLERQPRHKVPENSTWKNVSTRKKKILVQTIHLVFVVWGTVVFGLHIHASLQPTLPQCLMQVRPWATSEPSCYLAGLDCHMLDISGGMDEVQEVWSKFDFATVVQILIRHCPALEIPDSLSMFHRLRGIKVYNTTIANWGEAAAISSANHPELSMLFIIRVNLTDGLLPAGLQSPDFPITINDIEMCVTNLNSFPDDLDAKWPPGAIIQVEYSQLTTVPIALARLKPFYLFLTGNPITELPPEVFEVDGMLNLGISHMNIHELPRNVTNISPSLNMIDIHHTNISFFWSWVDELVGRVDNPAHFVAGGSSYCKILAQIESGSTKSFPDPLSREYSSILMNSTESNRPTIARAVGCNEFDDEPFYPLAYEDTINAI